MSLRVDPTDPTSPANPHLWKALTEPMAVYADHPKTPGDHEVRVYNEAREYTVNTDVGFCECPSFQYNCGDDEECKHLIRARLETGEVAIPDWVTRTAVDRLLLRSLEEVR